MDRIKVKPEKNNFRFLDEYRDRNLAKGLIRSIRQRAGRLNRSVTFMEVCGTHTTALFRHGIRSLLPDNVKIVSGPGCPVCVTSTEDIDLALTAARLPRTIVTSFGDMLRVPGSRGSLKALRSEGCDIRVVYSPLEAIELAVNNHAKRVVHLAVGFETTAPATAAVINRAREKGLDNFSVLCSHKLIPPALKGLAPESRIDGFMLPGHVSSIIGIRPYMFLARECGKSGVIAGFEAVDILQAIDRLLELTEKKSPAVENLYHRCVPDEGNPAARELLKQVFIQKDAKWRGFGHIPKSGLSLRPGLKRFDASRGIEMEPSAVAHRSCRCGEVLRGLISPPECKLFGNICVPETAVGPCMVSSEGACAAYYRYGSDEWKRR